MEINATIEQCNLGGLSAAIQSALPGLVSGVSAYGEPNRPISIWMADEAQQSDIDTALAVVAVHDPVFLSVDKRQIAADGIDLATVTVNAPLINAAAVVLIVTAGGVSQEAPITLVDGVGTETITALDPTTITVTVKDGVNRSTDSLSIEAV